MWFQIRKARIAWKFVREYHLPFVSVTIQDSTQFFFSFLILASFRTAERKHLFLIDFFAPFFLFLSFSLTTHRLAFVVGE